MMKKFLAGLQIAIIAGALIASCSMFGDMEDLREKAKEANTPANPPVITITKYLAGSTSANEGYTTGPTLSVTASVTQGATLSYQWYSNTTDSSIGGTAVSGTGPSYTIPAGYTIPEGHEKGIYYFFCEVRASGGAASVRTNVSTFAVTGEGVPVISIAAQPQSSTVFQGTISGNLTVEATVDPIVGLSYQWYQRTSITTTVAVSGATSETFSIPTNLTSAESPYYYYCEVRGTGAVTVSSETAEITVRPAKTVTVGAMQNGLLISGTAKAVSFPVTLVSIDEWTAGGASIAWYASDGTTPVSTPTWISPAASVSKTSDTNGTVNINATSAAVTGNYYFKVTVDGIVSNLATLTVSPPKSVTIGGQSGTLLEGTQGASTSFPVTTVSISSGSSGSVQWYTSSVGTTGATAPAGINASVTNVSGNNATVNISATAASQEGEYYFKVTIDSIVSSNVATLTVSIKYGTSNHPFLVTTEADLRRVGTETGDGDWTLSAHYEQTAAIPLTNLGVNPWTPIGRSDFFTGNYDGGGFAITNLTGSNGLFYQIGRGGVVKNVRLFVTITGTGTDFTGGVAGDNMGTVENCSVSGDVSSTYMRLGGVVGNNSGTVRNCYSIADITVPNGQVNYVGGAVGLNGDGGTVEYCYVTGSVTNNGNGGCIGGVVGYNNQSTVRNCVALNTSITHGEGRVIGANNSGPVTSILANNHGSMDISGMWSNRGLNAIDGADVSSGTSTGQYNYQPWWANASTGPGFVFGSDEDHPWKMTTGFGNLPKLWFEYGENN